MVWDGLKFTGSERKKLCGVLDFLWEGVFNGKYNGHNSGEKWNGSQFI
jgi:hypothetical protein